MDVPTWVPDLASDAGVWNMVNERIARGITADGERVYVVIDTADPAAHIRRVPAEVGANAAMLAVLRMTSTVPADA